MRTAYGFEESTMTRSVEAPANSCSRARRSMVCPTGASGPWRRDAAVPSSGRGGKRRRSARRSRRFAPSARLRLDRVLLCVVAHAQRRQARQRLRPGTRGQERAEEGSDHQRSAANHGADVTRTDASGRGANGGALSAPARDRPGVRGPASDRAVVWDGAPRLFRVSPFRTCDLW